MNVILTGLRGTGKSSIGEMLAQRLDFAFVDTDTAIEKRAACRIADIVARHGWEHFRALERQVVMDVAASARQVIAAGGGTLIDEENTRLLKAQGIVILLLCDLAILQRRIAYETNRPSLTGEGSAEAELEQVWAARRARYHAVADLTYDVSIEGPSVAHDLYQKAVAIHELLQHTPRFQEGHLS